MSDLFLEKGISNVDGTSKIGREVEYITDPSQPVIYWAKVMELCDNINKSPPETMHQCVRALTCRLYEENSKVIGFCLILIESLMKTCGLKFAQAIDKNFMDQMIVIAESGKDREICMEVLKLISEWVNQYEANRGCLPIFKDAYVKLKSKGIYSNYPNIDRTVLGSLTGNVISTSDDPNLSQFVESNSKEYIKLEKDLIVTLEKVAMCRDMIAISPGIDQDEALAEVIGYLEACRDRMVDLIDAGTNGLLSESLFWLCLKVNDAIINTLEAEKNGIRVFDEKLDLDTLVSSLKQSSVTNNLLDLGNSNVDSTSKGITAITISDDDSLVNFGTKSKKDPSANIPLMHSDAYYKKMESWGMSKVDISLRKKNVLPIEGAQQTSARFEDFDEYAQKHSKSIPNIIPPRPGPSSQPTQNVTLNNLEDLPNPPSAPLESPSEKGHSRQLLS